MKRYFFLHPTTRLRVRQIEREVEVPLPSVIRYTKELEKERILKKTSIANIIVYAADRNSRNFLLKKKLFNIERLFSSGLIDFLIGELSNPTIIVFGSYARGEDIESSDIDLYVETPTKKVNLERFERLLQRKIQIFMYKSLRNVENKDLANNIINGVIL